MGSQLISLNATRWDGGTMDPGRSLSNVGELVGCHSLAIDWTDLPRILKLLQDLDAPVDLSHYKSHAVRRSIARRMAITRVDTLCSYAELLGHSPSELSALSNELLIGVTWFFRDHEAFEALRLRGIPELLRSRPTRRLRIWVVGCSTGEEAYSLAILCREAQDQLGLEADIEIVATDVDRDAIRTAEAAAYPEGIACDLTPERLAKYFIRTREGYQVGQAIRERAVFAPHNLFTDPPLTNIDLISCRNLLIYLDNTHQREALQLFRFSLNPGGILFLGTSETTGELSRRFDPLDSRCRVYRARTWTEQAAKSSSLSDGSGFEQPSVDLEEDLRVTREKLRLAIQEIERSNAELRRMDEALSRATTREQARLLEITELTNDVENLLACTQCEVVFLDENLDVRGFNPSRSSVFHLEGRGHDCSIAGTTHRLIDIDLTRLVRQVQETLDPIEREVRTDRGERLRMRILPYRIGHQAYSGIILACGPIEPKNLEDEGSHVV